MATKANISDDIAAEHARSNDDKLEPVMAVTINGPPDRAIMQCRDFLAHGRALDLFGGMQMTSIDSDMLHFAHDEDGKVKAALRFAPAAGNRGTILSCVMHVDRSFGAIGKMAATAMGNDPALLARRDIRKLKQLCEAGEISTSTNNRFERDQETGVE